MGSCLTPEFRVAMDALVQGTFKPHPRRLGEGEDRHRPQHVQTSVGTRGDSQEVE